MGNKRISLTISEACKKEGIEYKSINSDFRYFMNDAKRLGQIFIELKIIAGDLEVIADRHKADGLRNILHKDALNLEKIDHEIAKTASKIMKESNE